MFVWARFARFVQPAASLGSHQHQRLRAMSDTLPAKEQSREHERIAYFADMMRY